MCAGCNNVNGSCDYRCMAGWIEYVCSKGIVQNIYVSQSVIFKTVKHVHQVLYNIHDYFKEHKSFTLINGMFGYFFTTLLRHWSHALPKKKKKNIKRFGYSVKYVHLKWYKHKIMGFLFCFLLFLFLRFRDLSRS